MKNLLIAMFALVAFAQVAHADVIDAQQDESISYSNQNSDNEWIRPGVPGPRPYPAPGPRPAPYPGPGPGHGPGHGGPGYPGPYPHPHPYPGPAPRPYPPAPVPGPGYPGPAVEYVRCDSYNYQYQECFFPSYRVARVDLYQVFSYNACIQNQTFGVYADRVWVTGGCSATFAITHF
ncbi:MAG TPA: DUF3011 domain-containing protein [Bdellovibrio sp.]|uniref:DUF3011 domain-containing protein n=1 Tax=Bdellovibrio sp. TaxID=28201 RepID=UPI002EEF3D11